MADMNVDGAWSTLDGLCIPGAAQPSQEVSIERGHKARELRGETFQEGGSPQLCQILPRGG